MNAKDEQILAQWQEDLKLQLDRKRQAKMEKRPRRTPPAMPGFSLQIRKAVLRAETQILHLPEDRC